MAINPLFQANCVPKSLLELNKVGEREKIDATFTQTVLVQITSRVVCEAGQRLQISKDLSIPKLEVCRGEKTADILSWVQKKIKKKDGKCCSVSVLRAACGMHTRWYRCQFWWRIGSLAEGEPT